MWKASGMGVGTGVLLIVIGLILLFAVQADLPYVSDDTLGIILLVAGILVIVLALVMNAQRRRTTYVHERYDPPPPPTV